MTLTAEKNHFSETEQVFDNFGLSYTLKSLHTYSEEQQPLSLILNLRRNKLKHRVGQANCLIETNGNALLGDLIIYDDITYSLTVQQRIYRLFNSKEPKNYRARGLGGILLQKIVDYARFSGIKKLHGSLMPQDIVETPQIINWYKHHGFAIEEPTREEIRGAKYRVCLYL